MEKIKTLSKEIYELKKQKEILEENLNKQKEELTTIENTIKDYSTLLLTEMLEKDVKNFSDSGLYADIYEKESVGYTSENDVIKFLKENYDGQYIRVKVTESLDKNALKKALKSSNELNEQLDTMTVKSTTRYVVVTDETSHEAMLQHINEQK